MCRSRRKKKRPIPRGAEFSEARPSLSRGLVTERGERKREREKERKREREKERKREREKERKREREKERKRERKKERWSHSPSSSDCGRRVSPPLPGPTARPRRGPRSEQVKRFRQTSAPLCPGRRLLWKAAPCEASRRPLLKI